MIADTPKGRGIQSIVIGGRLLDHLVLAARPMILRELAAGAGITPAQAHAYLLSLKRVGMIEQEFESGPYVLGPRALMLGLSRLGTFAIYRRTSRLLVELSSSLNVMAVFSVWGPKGPTAMQVVQARDKRSDLNIRMGTRFSVLNTAAGRVFGAFSTVPAVAERIEAESAGLGNSPFASDVASLAEYETLVSDVRKNGYSTIQSAGVPGIDAVSVPVFDEAGLFVGVLSCIGHSDIVDTHPDGSIIPVVCEKVRALRQPSAAAEEPCAPRAWHGRTGADAAAPVRAQNSEGRGVQSIEIGWKLLDALIERGEPSMLKDLAGDTGIAAAQAHPYLVSFRKLGLVEKGDSTGRYQIGPFALDLAITRTRTFDPMRRSAELVANLTRATGLTTLVSVWGAFGPTVVQVHEGVDQIHMNTKVGTVYSLTGTATGRVFAAYLSPDLIRPFLKATLPKTITERSVGVAQPLPDRDLATIREDGIASVERPPVPGINAIAAPVFDHLGQIFVVVTLVGDARVLSKASDTGFAQALRATTQTFSSELGYTPSGPLVTCQIANEFVMN